jgi:hypothetical protein
VTKPSIFSSTNNLGEFNPAGKCARLRRPRYDKSLQWSSRRHMFSIPAASVLAVVQNYQYV